MNKKIIFSVIAIMLVVALINGCEKATPIEVLPGEEAEKEAKETVAAYGWSVKDTESEAVKEAVSTMLRDMKDKKPSYVLFFMSSSENKSYDSTKILNQLRDSLGDVKIHGSTSAREVLTKDGVYAGKALVLMGIFSPRIKFGVGGADLDELTPQEAGRRAILEAMQDAGETSMPKLVYINTIPGNEEKILEGLLEVLGEDVPIFGGNSGDFGYAGKWSQIVNDKIYNNGIVVTAYYTDLKIGYAFDHGYIRSEKRGKITKAEGRTIYEIDNRPAGEVYNEWTGGLYEEELEKGAEQIHIKDNLHPLAKIFFDDKGIAYQVTFGINQITVPDHALTVFVDVDVGDEILYLEGNWEVLVNRAQTTTRKALASKDISKEDAVFGIYTFCSGTNLMIPEEERQKIPLLIKSELGNVPFIGMYAWGEQVYMPGVGTKNANLVNLMIIFSEE